MSTASLALYTGLAEAFKHFNEELFDNELPDCLITLAPKRNSYGYFWFDVVKAREAEAVGDGIEEPGLMDEIALNPHTFRGRTEREILSTLVHEMVHMWEFRCSGEKLPKRPTHTKVWAKKMNEVGLKPYNVKNPEKETGRNCSHVIAEGGEFDRAYASLRTTIDFAIVPAVRRKKKDRPKMVTVWCNCCQYKVRKPELAPDLSCVECGETLGPKEG